MDTDVQRAAARLAAFGLVEDVQVRDVSAGVAVAHAQARENRWPEVTRVLLYADIVIKLMVRHPQTADVIEQLADDAHLAGDQAMLSAALASRSEHNLHSDVPLLRQSSDHDLARATALLEFATGPALERATAHVACAVAYGNRGLWELEEELYAATTPLLAECEVPLLNSVVLCNRAEAQLRLLCGLHEVDETDELKRLAPAARDAVAAALAGTMPAAWMVEAAAFGQLLAALADGNTPVPSAALDQRVASLMRVRTGPVTGLLRLADALCAAHHGDWEVVAEQAELAIEMSADDYAASPLALGMRLAAQAEAGLGTRGAQRAVRYADYSARRRWQSRLQMVGSARASQQTEQLRIERDGHARAALVDELTGLANRRGYSRHLEQLRGRLAHRPLAVLLVDIDLFKGVNDNHGHAVGDEVLARVAATLMTGTRPDDLVARLGGDEFVVLLDDFDVAAGCRRAADMMRRLATVPWSSISPGLDVSVSIGVAAGSPNGDPEHLVRRADTALYSAKARGGGTVGCEETGEADASSRIRRPDEPRAMMSP